MTFKRLFAATFLSLGLAASAQDERPDYAIAIHGGAGSSPEKFSAEENQIRHDALKKALQIGVDILKEGGTSMDAVEAVIRQMEDDPLFNAGKGAVFNAAGGHELDASIMDGVTKECGAVAGVRTVKNPISLARLVMTKTRHVLLSGPGADAFAKEMEVPIVEQEYFSTEAAREEWEETQSRRNRDEEKKGTVGCVALDSDGNLAAGTSTGGLTDKKFGRVGDSPIIGAGTYADNETCAVSCTGIGEHFIRHAVAYDISAQMKYGEASVVEAVGTVLKNTLKPNQGGIIALSKNGEITTQFNTGGMACAAADSTGMFDVRWPGKSED